MASGIQGTQRSDGFRGGIQSGTSATTSSSISIETVIRDYLEFSGLASTGWVAGYTGDALRKMLGTPASFPMAGISPDGGIFLDADGKPLLAIECKKQGKNGNAIERWYKNFSILRALGIKRYVTFCRGEGFEDGNSAERIIGTAKAIVDRQSTSLWNDESGLLGFYHYNTNSNLGKFVPTIIRKELEIARAREGSA